jgi:hypothetical protein
LSIPDIGTPLDGLPTAVATGGPGPILAAVRSKPQQYG